MREHVRKSIVSESCVTAHLSRWACQITLHTDTPSALVIALCVVVLDSMCWACPTRSQHVAKWGSNMEHKAFC